MKNEAQYLKQLQEKIDELSLELNKTQHDSANEGIGSLVKAPFNYISNIGRAASRGFKGEKLGSLRNVKGKFTSPTGAKTVHKVGTVVGKNKGKAGLALGAAAAGYPAYKIGQATAEPDQSASSTGSPSGGPTPTGSGRDETQPMINPAIPDFPTVSDKAPEEKPLQSPTAPAAGADTKPEAEPDKVVPTLPTKPEPTVTKEPEEFKFNPEQEKWLGGANRKDPYIINRMPGELGPKPTLPKPDTEKELFRSMDPTHPRFNEEYDRLETQLYEELSRMMELAGLKK